MSIKLTQLIFSSKLDLMPSEKLVLLHLAYFANDFNNLLCCPSYQTLAEYCNLTRRHIRKVINNLCEGGILIKERIVTENGIIKSNNYFINEDLLNSPFKEEGGGVVQNPRVGSYRTPGVGSPTTPNKYNINKPIDNKKNIIKKRNSEKNEKYEKDAKELVDMFIRLTGKKYRYAPILMQPMIARLKEGYTLQECKTVIARKYNDWKNNQEMKMYIRPVTIFRASKFPEYLAECVTEEEKEKIKNEYSTKLDN